jgi:hypothetical protein
MKFSRLCQVPVAFATSELKNIGLTRKKNKFFGTNKKHIFSLEINHARCFIRDIIDPKIGMWV